MKIYRGNKEINDYLKLFENDYKDVKEIEDNVKKIIEDVKKDKDNALVKYTKKFDTPFFEEKDIYVTGDEIDFAYDKLKREEGYFIDALNAAYENIYEYHQKQKEESWFFYKDGSVLGQIIRPLERVGIYVPGGKGAYPSTVLMNAIPAKVAGVHEIIMVTPPKKDKSIDEHILAAAKLCKINKIFKVGGAHAIAALSFGTNIIPKVDKIVGPGNIYVALAKKLLYGYVDIDSVAGPSEILVIADKSANSKYIAADLLSQAEHDTLAKSILITDSESLANEVNENIKDLLRWHPNHVAFEAIEKNGAILIVERISDAIDYANIISPEHLQIVCENSDEMIQKIKNAGAIFVGEYSPEPIGDYIAGPNHVLPTSGTARFFSALGVYHFIKRISLIKYSKERFLIDAPFAHEIAIKEGFYFHANSLKVRIDDV